MKTQLISLPVFILSFTSLVCACFGGIGLVFSIVALYIANQKIKQAYHNPLGYSGSLGTMKLAKISAIISLAVNLFYLAYSLILIYQNGFQAFQERWLNMMFLR